MKFVFAIFGLLLMSPSNGCNIQEASAAAEKRSETRTSAVAIPVVVELFQSQGCSSCPPANAALNAIAGRSDVLALSYSVTYWDRLGWKDIYGDPAYTRRQRAYAEALENDNVYTPQVVLNGRRDIVGNAPGELDRAIAATPALTGGPSISFTSDEVTIGVAKGSGEILLVRYDPRTHQVAIGAGENGGRRLPHRNIVRQLVRLGDWDGERISFRMPAVSDPAWRSVIIVQAKRTGPILAARRL